MKILIGCDSYHPDVNGASYFAQRLAATLHQRGHTVHVVRPSHSTRASLTEQNGVVVHGIPSAPLPFQRGFRVALVPFVKHHIRRVVRAVAPDVLHVQSHFGIGRSLIGIARTQHLPIVATNHFMPDNLVYRLRLPAPAEQRLTDWAWQDFARVFNQVETITTPTPIAAQLIHTKGITRPVLPISCGIDRTRFRPHTPDTALRQRYTITARPTYMYVGRLDEEKHIDDLIRALPIVRRHVDAQLVLVGSGPHHAELAALAQSLQVADDVIFTGFVPDDELPHMYALCDVFCNAGIAELQSIVTMEALASGKPVVAANVLALPHLVHDGVNGYTFAPRDSVTLAARLTTLLTDDDQRLRMGQQSLQIIAQHDLHATVQAYEHVYDSAVARAMRRQHYHQTTPDPLVE